MTSLALVLSLLAAAEKPKLVVLSTWQRPAHRPLQEPKLFVAQNRVFAADVNGVVLEFPVECP